MSPSPVAGSTKPEIDNAIPVPPSVVVDFVLDFVLDFVPDVLLGSVVVLPPLPVLNQLPVSAVSVALFPESLEQAINSPTIHHPFLIVILVSSLAKFFKWS